MEEVKPYFHILFEVWSGQILCSTFHTLSDSHITKILEYEVGKPRGHGSRIEVERRYELLPSCDGFDTRSGGDEIGKNFITAKWNPYQVGSKL